VKEWKTFLRWLGGLVAEGTAVSLIGLRSIVRRLQAEGASRSSSESGAEHGTEHGAESGAGRAAGRGADASPAVLKLVGVHHRQAVAEAAYEMLGPRAIALDGARSPIAHELLLTRCLSIAGGTTQILLTQAAERLLGLPREPVG